MSVALSYGIVIALYGTVMFGVGFEAYLEDRPPIVVQNGEPSTVNDLAGLVIGVIEDLRRALIRRTGQVLLEPN